MATTPMTRHLVKLIFLFVALTATTAVHAQSQDSNYTVRIPPFMSLTALRGPQFQNHPGTSADILMTNSLWFARTASGTGSTVTLSTDRAFENVGNASYKRDVRLRIPTMYVSPGSGWEFDTALDQTDYAAGDETATVQVSSDSAGVALILLHVTFLTGDVSTLAGGRYEVTVTGTISEN